MALFVVVGVVISLASAQWVDVGYLDSNFDTLMSTYPSLTHRVALQWADEPGQVEEVHVQRLSAQSSSAAQTLLSSIMTLPKAPSATIWASR